MIGFTVEVAPVDDLADRVDVTDQLDEADCRKPLNEAGVGSVTVPYGETITPDPLGKVLIFSFDGVEAFSVFCTGRSDVQVDPTGEAEMVTVYSGKGLASVLEAIRVRPVLGFDRSPWARSRAYGPFALEFDYSGWPAATEYGTVSSDSTYWGMFSGFPDFDVPRIGPAEGDENGAPQGYWDWQGEFSLPDGVGLAWFELVDNSQDAYLQSFQLSRVKLDGQVGSFTVAQRFDFDYVSPGTIRVGGRVVNVPFGGGDPGPGEGPELPGNPTFAAVVIFELLPDGRLGDKVFETSSATCKVLSYADPPPGMTDLEVIEAIVADNPNALQPTVIGHGAFDPQPSITVRVGADNLLQHLRNRADGSWIDWTYGVDTNELHVWPAGERGGPSGVTYTAADGSLQFLAVEQLAGGPDCVHVSWDGPDVLVGDGERMAYLSTNALDVTEAKARGLAALATPNPTSYDVRIAPTGDGDIPGVHVLDGDDVAVEDHTGLRLREWSMQWPDPNGEPAFRVVVGDQVWEEAERRALWLERAAPGHMGGNQPANPAPDSPFEGRRSTFEAIDFGIAKGAGASDYVAGEATVDEMAGVSFNLCAFRFTAKELTSGTATVVAKVDGVTVATANLTAPNLSVIVPTDDRYWIAMGSTRLTVELTAVGSGLEGIQTAFLGVI